MQKYEILFDFTILNIFLEKNDEVEFIAGGSFFVYNKCLTASNG